MIQRKLIAASLASTLFAIVLSFIYPNPYNEEFLVNQNYLYASIKAINFYLIYSVLIFFTYGVLICFNLFS